MPVRALKPYQPVGSALARGDRWPTSRPITRPAPSSTPSCSSAKSASATAPANWSRKSSTRSSRQPDLPVLVSLPVPTRGSELPNPQAVHHRLAKRERDAAQQRAHRGAAVHRAAGGRLPQVWRVHARVHSPGGTRCIKQKRAMTDEQKTTVHVAYTNEDADADADAGGFRASRRRPGSKTRGSASWTIARARESIPAGA